MGKKSSKKVAASDSEKALAQVSMQKHERYKSLYRPVEDAHKTTVSQDVSPLLRGRATADVAQAAGGSTGAAVALGRGSTTKMEGTAELGGARSLAAVSANRTADDVRTKGRLGTLAIAQDMSADAQAGLSAAARASNTEAMAKARAQNELNTARQQALGQVIGAGAGAYQQYQNNKRVDTLLEAYKSKKPGVAYDTIDDPNKYRGYA